MLAIKAKAVWHHRKDPKWLFAKWGNTPLSSFFKKLKKIKWKLIYKHKTRVAKPALLLLLKVVTPLFNHYQIRNIKEGMDLLALVAEVFEL